MRTVYGSDGNEIYVDHEGVVQTTELAKCYRTEFGDVWIPKSLILDEGDDLFSVPKWFAEKEGLI
jgi:hypothetical protein